MTLREYRVKNKMTQAALAEKIRPVYQRVNVPLISLIERGVVDPPQAIREWLEAQGEAEAQPMTQTELHVLAELHLASANNPVTRSRLKDLTHDCDRNNRKMIADLRDRGYWIVGGEANGYYMAKDKVELTEWLDTYSAYAYTILSRRAKMLWRRQ